MSEKLIKVEKSDGQSATPESKAFRLDTSAKLSDVRGVLKSKGFMGDTDAFLLDNSPIDASDEAETPLSDLLGDTLALPLKIGRRKADLGEASTDGNLQRYASMLPEQKQALLSRLEIYRGLTITKNGLERSANQALAPLHDDRLPAGTRVTANDTRSDYTFHETTQKLFESSLDTASVSLTTPYGGGNASFEYARSKSTDSKTVTEYLVGRKLIQKVKITLGFADLMLTKTFQDEVLNALKKEQTNKGIQAYNLVDKLNKIGYYVPLEFTLGGALLTTDETRITEWSQAETEKQKFEAGVDASYGGISGNAKASHEEEKKNEQGETNKYKGLTFKQVSGKAVDPESFPQFLSSLESSINWDVIAYHQLCPSLALLSDNKVRNYCLNLLDKYGTYDQIIELQPYIDLIGYSTDVTTTYLRNKPS